MAKAYPVRGKISVASQVQVFPVPSGTEQVRPEMPYLTARMGYMKPNATDILCLTAQFPRFNGYAPKFGMTHAN